MVNFNTKFDALNPFAIYIYIHPMGKVIEKRKEVQHGKFEHGELKLLLVNYVAI
jgi:hypothetical protein